jgi:hypothetical protein
VIGFGEEVGTELEIIIEVEGSLSLETYAEVCESDGFFFFPDTSELFVRVLRHPRRPTTSTTVVL